MLWDHGGKISVCYFCALLQLKGPFEVIVGEVQTYRRLCLSHGL